MKTEIKSMKEYYNILTKRINDFKKHPLPSNWDGIYIATSK